MTPGKGSRSSACQALNQACMLSAGQDVLTHVAEGQADVLLGAAGCRDVSMHSWSSTLCVLEPSTSTQTCSSGGRL